MIEHKAWLYSQTLGWLWDPQNKVICNHAYSGHEDGLNNPYCEHVPFVGPIPRGLWKIKHTYKSDRVGPVAIVLEPHGHDAHGRTYFRIHGDNRKMDKSASKGCIIAPRDVREVIQHSDVRFLRVVT